MTIDSRPPDHITRLLRGERVTRDAEAIEEALLTAARLVVLELEALRASTDGDTGRIVDEVHRTAAARGVATIGAIGVTCVLAGQLRRPDEAELAATLRRARGAFTDRELLDGASALCGAGCVALALTFGLHPADVAEMVDAVARRHESDCRGRRRPSRPIANRCRRPARPQSAAG